jgi:hypothetical protein
LRQICADARRGHDDLDCADRASLGAEPVTDALVPIGDRGFSTDDGEHVSLRANVNAGSAAYAVIDINVRMLGPGSFRDQTTARCRGQSLSFPPLHTPDLGDDRESEDRQ